MVGIDAQKAEYRWRLACLFFDGTQFHARIDSRSFLLVIGPSWAEEAIIADGDTLILNGIPYRLDGIDAPETDQVCLNEKRNVWACGLEARDQLSKFVGKRDVRCDSKGFDTVYRNRRAGVCWIEGETTSLNQWLVREGWALNFEPYAKGRFKADEDDARRSGRGLWSGCFSRPQEAGRWNKSRASLLGGRLPAKHRNSQYAIP